MEPAHDGSGAMKKRCTATSVVDDKAMQRQLDNINQNYQNKVNGNP